MGNAVAGPIGGAIGSVIGQVIDRAIFAPPRRDGPRLQELAVQTSSYGTQIPKLFGTIRVAGTVIWSTDLIERRANGGSKNARTNDYSYSASFAVLLSARPIVGIGRIWAEGKLLRGVAGDWKSVTGFRLHRGGEDQPVDPLIGSALGAWAPAHRGCAYAVFEGLQLADYGNRIPSLTFEVIADAAPVRASAIAHALAGEVEGEVALAIDGFAASGSSVAAVLDTLAAASGAWWAPRGARLTMCDAAGAVVAIDDAGIASDADGVRRGRRIAALETVPRTVHVAHYDPARDYQVGVQRSVRPGAGEIERRIEMPAVLSASAAKGIAAGVLARAEAGRTQRRVSLGFEAMAVAPGACVSIAGEAGVWRVASAALETMVMRLDLVPITRAPTLVASAASGAMLATPDAVIGTTIVHAFELPVLDGSLAIAPRLSIAACGTGAGWRQAALLHSADDGASWVADGATAAEATIGRVETAADAAPATLVDERGAFVVVLARADMVLADADAGAIDRGANLALIGNELVQFATALPIGGARWRLSGLRRGCGATEAAIGKQRAGDRFVLVETAALRTIDLTAASVGGRVRVLAAGVGDGEPAAAEAVIAGASVLPPSPVHLQAASASNGALALRWVRRSRLGWRWIDGAEVPIAEERERYRVTIASAGGERIVEADEPWLRIEAAMRPAGDLVVTVRQRGTWGLSPAASIVVPAGEAT
ncbi:phage tail protein [Sphingomonas sp. Tas61C01]|uniref:phage tail protein n=1 Tax=Sphingomonas sp. Tas61C01 TaxID=3458297 RepID=UPI00403E7858